VEILNRDIKMKLRNYFSISTFLIITLSFIQPIYSQIVPGQITSYEADETIPYNWFSYVPLSVKKTHLNYIIVIAEGSSDSSINPDATEICG